MPIVLPVFRGYTVDVRLREFRKVNYGSSLEFISFDSLQGRRLPGSLVSEHPTPRSLFSQSQVAAQPERR